MSIESQKIIEIIQYISFAGLILSAIAVYFIPDLRKKIILLFLLFISTMMLSFVFYSGILIFIAGLSFIFIFILLHLLAVLLSSQSGPETMPPPDAENKAGMAIAVKIISIIMPVLFCTGSGYLIYKITGGYFLTDGSEQEVIITGMEEISDIIFNRYSIIILLFAVAVLVSFIWFTIILMTGRKTKESTKNEQ